jgi:hypothetical protein
MKQRTYCAVIGDINRSRSLTDRSKVQRRFVATMEKINREFKDAIAAQFLVTVGDEFQGLLVSPEASYEMILRIEELMQSIPFACGVGVGTLATPLRKEALGMDGEVFHRARNALAEAKRRKRSVCYSFESPSEPLINALVALMDRHWHGLTGRQRQIARLLKDGEPKHVARRLHISVQAISKARRSSSLAELEEARVILQRFLASLN